jgi:hypothetical protein
VKLTTTKTGRTLRRLPDRCFPAIVAVGSSLVALPAGALELGELTVQSRLGQPLRASIAYALAPTERISDNCVTMRPGPSVSGLPNFGAARISISNGVILLSGETPVREPMVSAHVVVNCPYSANLSREYLLFIDPETRSNTAVYQETAVTQQATRQSEPVVVAPSAIERPVSAILPEPVVRDIETSTRYQVQRGETLSDIAARIQNRPIGLWPAVNVIFEANPSAFTNNDPNNVKAGSWLSIPSFDSNAAVVLDVQPVDAAVEVYEPSFAAEVVPTEEATVAVAIEADLSIADAYVTDADSMDVSDAPAIVLDDLANTGVPVGELQAGEFILDTELPGPTTSSTSPNVTTAVVATDSANDNSASDNSGPPSWANWLAGGVIAIAFGLIMYRRRLDGQAKTEPDGPLATDQPLHRFSDTPSSNAPSTETNSIEIPEADYDISDDSPTDKNPILDADLVMKTGLSDSSNSEPSHDFRIAASTDLDAEMPPEPTPAVEVSIFDGELWPDDVDDDYDMSVIIDATKVPLPDNIEVHDVNAVEVTTVDDTIMMQTTPTEKYAGYDVIEQVYEDELTATQALNLEIEQAAADLAKNMEIEVFDNADDKADDNISELPLATVTELEAKALLPARDEKVLSPDETDDSESITARTIADEETAEIPIESGKSS